MGRFLAKATYPTPVVAIGGSAGAIEALRGLLPLLQPRWGVAFALVLHRKPAEDDERLEVLLGKWASIEVVRALDKMPIVAGRAVVCPADLHMIVHDAQFRLTKGPLEHRARPAVDVTFRSVANECGESGGGIVLSGLLDDGAAGIVALRNAGGLTVAQAPDEAAHRGMPVSAIDAGAGVVARIAAMPQILEAFADRAKSRERDDRRRSVQVLGRSRTLR
jgi:two-component system, chemotaxis family, protein-glutamate methylesterase/glutaminase